MLHLNIIKVKTPEEMGKAAADEFEAVIHAKPACVIGLATTALYLPATWPPTSDVTVPCPSA